MVMVTLKDLVEDFVDDGKADFENWSRVNDIIQLISECERLQRESCGKAVVYDLGGNKRSDLNRSTIAVTCRKARVENYEGIEL